MKIAIIGSTSLKDTIVRQIKERLEAAGHTVRTPVFDEKADRASPTPEDDLMQRNREMMAWADEVVGCYNGRSVGLLVDAGTADTLGKPFYLAYLEELSFVNYLKQYARRNPARHAMEALKQDACLDFVQKKKSIT